MATLPVSCQSKMIAALVRRWGGNANIENYNFVHIIGRKWAMWCIAEYPERKARCSITATFTGPDNRMKITATSFRDVVDA